MLLAVEQLRRQVPGGIGAYARGLLGGLAERSREGDPVDVTLLASRPPGRRADDPLAAFGRPVIASRLPGPLLTRAWDHGLRHAPSGFDVVHSVSLATPTARPSSGSRAVVTVHDVAWRRHPEATTPRGRRWHQSALVRAREGGAALVVPSRLVAADVAAFGVDPGRITVVRGGADHLPEPDPAATEALLGRLGVPGEFLLTVGTLEPRKNVDRLVRAFHTVRPSLPGPWPLVIVGPAGWVGAVHAPRHRRHRVHGVGVRARPRRALPAGAAFAYVPLTEGYGLLPPLESMRVGTPSVVSDEVPSVHDLGEVGPAPARIVDPFDVEDIAAGLAAVLTDDAARSDLAHAVPRTRWLADLGDGGP